MKEMKEVIILLLSLIAGGCGYLVVTFWMSPILRYLQIRHEVTSDLIFYANVISADNVCDELKQRHEARQESNRKHAAEMAACYYRLPKWYKWLLKWRDENPLVASRHLIGLSNCSTHESADPHIQWLKKSLRIDPQLDV
jgi:hypothetical protein